MKLYAKILPKYLDRILKGEKSIDYRQFESIVFENTETGERIEFDIEKIITRINQGPLKIVYKDIPWHQGKHIYGIKLGRRL